MNRLLAWWAKWSADKGITTPLLAPMLAAVLTLLLLIPVARIIIAQNLPLTVKWKDDMRAYMSMRLVTPADHRPAVYNLGGSGLLRAIEEDTTLEQQFEDRFQFYNLTTPSQSNVESLALLKSIDLREGDLVVMHINISRINNLRPLKHWICDPYFYTLHPGDLIAILNDLGLNAEINPLCHVTWLSRQKLLKTMIKNYRLGEQAPQYTGIYPLPQDRDPIALEKLRATRLAKQADPSFDESWLVLHQDKARKNIELLRQMHDYATAIGAKFVLVDPPMNRDWFLRYHGKWFPFEEEYQALFKPLVNAGVDYRDLRNLPDYHFDDFYDQTHMLEHARRKFWPLYQALVTEKLTDYNHP